MATTILTNLVLCAGALLVLGVVMNLPSRLRHDRTEVSTETLATEYPQAA
jgi:hypothetical protein